MISSRALWGLAVLLFLVACQPATPSPTTPATLIPTTLPTPALGAPEGLYPTETRTGVPQIDMVLEAVTNEDIEALRNLAALIEVPCTSKRDRLPTRPICPEGVEEGTPIAMFAVWSCEYGGYFTSLEEAYQYFPSPYQQWPLYVYAIYHSPRSAWVDLPIAYEIVLASDLEETAWLLILNSEGKIIGTIECTLPRDMVLGGADFILPPLSG